MYNPFIEKKEQGDDDALLIGSALEGKQESLEKLILRHQAWIYNIAFKMVMDHDDASDVTQEILIKMITNLSTYDRAKGAFRTWLYRIVVNHIITMKKKKFEVRIHDFDRYVSLIENLPDHRSYSPPDAEIMALELKTGCMMGMLMCLNRRDRLVFLLGAVFDVTDAVGSEIMDITRDNFRKILSRARHKVYSYMNGVCGHINPDNPCRCENKMKNFVDLGMIQPDRTRYCKLEQHKVRDVISEEYDRFTESFHGPFLDHFKDQPFYDPPDMVQWLKNMLDHDEFKNMFHLH
jgi:RNA polymerase sigma factor (sigma-70 family)